MANKNIKNLDLPDLKRLCNLLEIGDGLYRKTLYLHKNGDIPIAHACKVTGVSRNSFHRYLRKVDSKIGIFLKVVSRGY